MCVSNTTLVWRRYGRISDIQLMTDRDTGRSRGFGFVTYEDTATVEQVSSFSSFFFPSSPVFILYSRA